MQNKSVKCKNCGNNFYIDNKFNSSNRLCSLKCVFENIPKIIDPVSNCWISVCCKTNMGYAIKQYNKKQYYVHRLSLELYGNEKTTDIKPFVLHECNNPACCNPEHLRPGDAQDNANDTIKSNRVSRCIGKTNPKTKLTNEQVMEIYNDKSDKIDIIKKWKNKISGGAIYAIKNGDNWNWLTKHNQHS